jgi:hypothetical protein
VRGEREREERAGVVCVRSLRMGGMDLLNEGCGVLHSIYSWGHSIEIILPGNI